jgi:hypothetical protein
MRRIKMELPIEAEELLKQLIGDFDLESFFEDLQPTEEEQQLLARSLANYAALKVQESLGDDVASDIKIVEAGLINMKTMTEAKVAKLTNLFNEDRLRNVLSSILQIAISALLQKINEGLTPEPEETEEESTED